MTRRGKAHTAAIIAVLGIAIGLSTTVFGVVDALLLRPVPARYPSRTVSVGGLGWPPFEDPILWWGKARSFDILARYESGLASEGDGQTLQGVRVTAVTPGFFDVFGVSAVWGRVFTEGEALRNEAVAVISHAFHISRFGKTTSPLGAEIRLNGIPHTVVGVLPEEFDFPSLTQVWVPRFGRKAPLQTAPVQPASFVSARDSGFVGLLAEGVSPGQAENEIRILLKRLHEEFTPKTGVHYGEIVGVRNLRERMGHEARPALLVLFAGALCVLLVASVNSSTILLGRAAARKKEVAIRLSLGATPGRIAREVLGETLAIALLSGVSGALCAVWSAAAIRGILAEQAPELAKAFSIRIETLVFCAGISLAAGLPAGFAPALQALA